MIKHQIQSEIAANDKSDTEIQKVRRRYNIIIAFCVYLMTINQSRLSQTFCPPSFRSIVQVYLGVHFQHVCLVAMRANDENRSPFISACITILWRLKLFKTFDNADTRSMLSTIWYYVCIVQTYLRLERFEQ